MHVPPLTQAQVNTLKEVTETLAVSEVAYSRYGLKGTARRAFLGEALRAAMAGGGYS